MPRLHDLQQQRKAKVTELRSIQTAADNDSRDLSDNERQRFDTLESEVRSLDSQIDRAARLETLERAAAADPVQGTGNREFDREAQRYSLTRAIAHVSGLRVDAKREEEISQEIEHRTGRKAQGIFGPDNVFRVPRNAAAEERVVTSSGDGAGLIFEEARPQDYIDALRANLVTGRLGARTLSGLQGNVSIPKLNASAGSEWIAEDGALTAADGDWDKVTMTPKHVGALTSFSRNMLLQSSPDIETLIRQDFAASMAVALDSAALIGGGSNEPDGIITQLIAGPGLGTLGTPSWSEVLGMIASIELANAATGRLGWAVNPRAVQTLRSTVKVAYGSPETQDAGAGFLMDGPNSLAGYTALSTTSLPQSLGSPDPGAAIFGDWSSLLIGLWSGVDILANPYGTGFDKGNTHVRGLLTADVAVRHIESFTAATDIPTAA